MIEFIKQYFHALRMSYLEIFVVLASVVTVAIDTFKGGGFVLLNILAMIFLLTYIVIVFGSNYKLTKSITKDVNSVFSICLGKSRDATVLYLA
jgi:hypothetical protein